jgi:hypothetical protein
MKIQNPTAIGIFIISLLFGGERVWAAMLYVSQTSTNPTPPYATWETAAHTIQEAVDAASDGDTVLVAAGVYALSAQVTIYKAIVLRSESGAGQTTLSGQSSTRCLWTSNPGAVVDGFTVKNGREPDGAVLADGLVMIGGVLRNSIVKKEPSPSHESRLVYCAGGGLITDCHIGPNSGFAVKGAGVYLTDSELRNSTVSDMSDAYMYGGAVDGAGVYAVSSTLTGCTITANWARRAGGGAYLDRCVVDRCIITNNQAGVDLITAGLGGGIFAFNSVIRNSLISANVADAGYDPVTDTDGGLPGFGGGVYFRGGNLLNCTITGNRIVASRGTEPPKGGGVYVESGNIRNSIVYFNAAPSEPNWHNVGAGFFDHTCTIPDPGGIGNISGDPRFVDPTNSNYRLAPTSPCIDAGLNEEWMSGAQDADANPRIFNGIVDLGGWEYTPMQPAP